MTTTRPTAAQLEALAWALITGWPPKKVHYATRSFVRDHIDYSASVTDHWRLYASQLNDGAPDVRPAVSAKTISAQCPTCGWKFRPMPAMRTATTVHDRTCRNQKCRKRWRIIVRPVRTGGAVEVRIAELSFLGRGR